MANTGVLTIYHYDSQVNNFIEDIRDTKRAYYVFVGKPDPWLNANGAVDETAVPVANDSIEQNQLSVYHDMLYGKLINTSDVSVLIPRYNWTSGTIYDAYDEAKSNLFDTQFYVINDQYDVYKCIYRNVGSASTVKPSLTATSGTFQTADGYIWKYMYSVDPASNTKFTSASYIPIVPNANVQGNATPGSIDAIVVTNGGVGYDVNESGNISSVINPYTIRLPNTSSSSDGYYANSSIYLQSGFGTGQVRIVNTYNGTTKLLTVSPATPFSAYTTLDVQNANGTVATGYTVEQKTNYLSYIYSNGYFNVGDTVVQSDTSTTGNIIAANTTTLQVVSFSTNNFLSHLPIIGTSQAGNSRVGNVSFSNTGGLSVSVISNNGTGYTANAAVTIISSDAGANAVANAHANTTGKIDVIYISSNGVNYFANPTAVIAMPSNTTITVSSPTVIGANSGTPNNIITISSANSFVANDAILYFRATSNTSNIGLVSGATYYIDVANSTTISLKASTTGTRIVLTPNTSAETGHSFRGVQATVSLYSNCYVISNTTGTATQLNDSANGYSNGQFIKIGNNVIRRVLNAVNSSIIITDTSDASFANLASVLSSTHLQMPIAARIDSVTTTVANASVVQTNLTARKLYLGNTALPGVNFTIGEKIDLVDSANTYQAANGIVSFANSTLVYVGAVSGNWTANLYALGESSLQKAYINQVDQNQNITIDNISNFTLGQKLYFKFGASYTGNADLVNLTTIPNQSTPYSIGPQVLIRTPDVGSTNASAIAIVNTAFGSGNTITNIQMINSGAHYTKANVSIYANSQHGSGATANPTISPLRGHGYSPQEELGGRYAGVSLTFDTVTNESYGFPGYGTFRRIGIIESPQFKDVWLTLNNFDRVNFGMTTSVTSSANLSITSWIPGEVAYQPSTNAAGIVVYGNSTFVQLKNVLGTFNPAGSNVYTYYSNTTADLTSANVVYFTVGNGAEVVSEATSNASGAVTQIFSNTAISISNVTGQFVTNDVLFDPIINAYATVSTIKTANGTRDVTSTFGLKFNQTVRLTLTSNTAAFANNEFANQDISFAGGRIISTNDDIDLQISSNTFTNNALITSSSGATGRIIFANTTYLKLTNISKNFTFATGQTISSGSVTSLINLSLPVLIISDLEGQYQAGSTNQGLFYNIHGSTSNAVGQCNSSLLITNPELVRDSGKVIYTQYISPVTRTATSKEQVSLVIKF
jgi:hypothetical protein